MAVFDIEQVNVYDVHPAAAEQYKQDMQEIVKGPIKVVDSPQEAAVGDAVICVTQSKDKFVKDSWIAPGTIVFPMGSYQECEDDFIRNADKIIVDHIDQREVIGCRRQRSQPDSQRRTDDEGAPKPGR